MSANKHTPGQLNYDLPGPGDRATWGHHAAAPRSPDFEGDDDAQDATETNLEALGEWLETFQSAARLRDWRRMERARMFAVSLMDSLIEVAR